MGQIEGQFDLEMCDEPYLDLKIEMRDMRLQNNIVFVQIHHMMANVVCIFLILLKSCRC